jgi:iron complex outermembrane receptor protein
VGGLDAERLTAFEIGYRRQFGSAISIDATAFANQYGGLRSGRLAGPPQVLLTAGGMPYLLLELNPNNGLDARTSGVEVAAEWHAMPWWRIQPVVSWLHAEATSRSSDPITTEDATRFARNSPRVQWSLRSSMNLPARTQFDLWLRRTGGIGSANFGSLIPAYTTLDLRLAWRAAPGLELSLVGQNLLESLHREILPDLLPSQPLQVERAFYAKVRWQY